MTERRRVRTGEATLDVLDAGEGPAVLLLHGWPETSRTWRRVMPRLVGAGYRVLAPDQRGFAGSDRPRPVRAYRLEATVGDARALLDALGLERAHVIGHDWGGLVAYGLAMAHPERVDRLVVLNQLHPARLFEAARTTVQMRRAAYAVFFQLPWLPERAVSAGRCFALRRWVWRGASAHAFSQGDLAAYAEAFGTPAAVGPSLRWYRAIVRDLVRGTTPPIRPVRCPTLAIFGTDDAFLHGGFARPHPEHVPDLRFVPVPGASHWVHHDAPERVVDEILAFLDRP